MIFTESTSGRAALKNRREDTENSFKFPQNGDERIRNGLIFPRIRPSFKLEAGMTGFMVGSCFAREIESKLSLLNLPTTNVSVPPEANAGRNNSIINEFNPGCIAQRINWAVDKQDTREFEDTVSISGDLGKDLLLAKGNALELPKVMGIREHIDQIYAALPVSDVLVITLGMTQAWLDRKNNLFLNRMPSPREIKREPDRYSCEFFSLEQTVAMLTKALSRAFDSGLKNALITVSPVPLQSTFLPMDCTLANMHSKSTLRLAASELVRTFSGQIDYFPSYEIVMSGGLQAFQDDNIHVRRDVVEEITSYMVSEYIG
ncbi:MAG: hypothetical protein GJ676_02610 [Rhodobacteraceae bacterium]|nr:hypothetical protein [Paracoccaceae bacterium]